MSDYTETFESLWAFCTANERVIPREWQKLYEMLAFKRQKPSGGWMPSLPLILAAWNVAMPAEKQLRFKEHIQWASYQNQLPEIGCYLRSLSEDQWFHFSEV